jgi:hypothetical protein
MPETKKGRCEWFFLQSDPFQLILSSNRYCSRIITNLYPMMTVHSTLSRLSLTAGGSITASGSLRCYSKVTSARLPTKVSLGIIARQSVL